MKNFNCYSYICVIWCSENHSDEYWDNGLESRSIPDVPGVHATRICIVEHQ